MLKKLSLNLFSFLSMLLIVGCSAKQKIMGETFEFTQSPCLDGLVLNISNSSCEVLYTGRDSDTGGLKMRCTSAKESTHWTESRWRPFCIDQYGTIYIENN
mgnify:CR=1 FL=1